MDEFDKVKDAVLVLFDESFVGEPAGQEYTWIVERDGGGLFDTLSGISARQASYKSTPETNSIAAHANHLRQALAWSNAEYRGETTEGDWEATWLIQSVDDGQWSSIVQEMRSEYGELRGHIAAMKGVTEDEALIELMCAPAHELYHLGAIRQLMKVAKAADRQKLGSK